MRISSARRSSPGPVDIVTYRLSGKMMYVPPAQDFDQAVTFARSAFESDLTGVDRNRISFSLNVLANGKQSTVGITSAAWPKVASHLARYEIIDIHVRPEIKVSPPPSYHSRSSTERTEKEQLSSSRCSPQPSSRHNGLSGWLRLGS